MADKKKSNKGIVIFILIGIIALLAAGTQIFTVIKNNSQTDSVNVKITKTEKNGTNTSGSDKTLIIKNDFSSKKIKSKSPYIAQLKIHGTIEPANNSYNQKWLLNTISKIKDDSNNAGILITINSPGGTVYEADEAYLALMNYKKETGRPVYVYLESLAASGGYYIACSGDYIMANRNTLTGSIGVIAGQFVDLTELMNRYGIKSTTIHAGRNKIMGSFNEPMTEEQRQIMQSIADECYQQFTDIVAESRKLNISKVYELADGRIYTAKQAVKNGLCDAIGSYDDCVNYMKHKEFEETEVQTITFSYEKEQNFYNLIRGAVKDFKLISQDAALPEIVKDAVTPDCSFPAYLYK